MFTDKNKINLLIDCSSIVWAAYHTMGTLSYSGEATGVIYGFLSKVLTLSKKFNTNKFYFAWDHYKNFRRIDYPAYKEHRRQKRKELSEEEREGLLSKVAQEEQLRQTILKQMGFMNHFYQEGFEADDLLAALAKKLSGQKTLMVTNDADMYQCLNDCNIINPASYKRMTKKILLKSFGVTPEQWPLCKAIGGCSSDNVMGIQGASDPKNSKSKAIKYVLGQLTGGKIKERIESKEGQKIIRRNLPIVTCPYCPDYITKEKVLRRILIRRNKFSRKQMLSIFDRYRFKSFLDIKKFGEWSKCFINP